MLRRCSGLRLSALALPPFRPPVRPRCATFLPGLTVSSTSPVAISTIILASWAGSRGLKGISTFCHALPPSASPCHFQTETLPKIRIDLRVPIEFDDALIRPLRSKQRRCAVATIHYSAVDGKLKDGVLIYIKPMLLGSEPPDVESYAASQRGFPHESTANQWFNESQTESYRMLGLHTVDEICQGWAGGSLEDFGRHVEEIYLGHPKARETGSVS
jgi:hypothetical protein